MNLNWQETLVKMLNFSLNRLKEKRLDEFLIGFSAISTYLKEIYQLITMGGNAELELFDSLDPFAEGVLFSAMPLRKTWKNIALVRYQLHLSLLI